LMIFRNWVYFLRYQCILWYDFFLILFSFAN
jgi:hypothetical protein